MLGRKPVGVLLTVATLCVALLGLPAAANALIPSTISVSANPTIVSYGAQVPLTVTVNANDDAGANSEYWVLVTDPGANLYSYNGSSWVSGASIYGSGPLADFNSTITTSPLNAAGVYTVQVIIDFTVDGVVTPGSTSDTITITVNSQVQVLPSIHVTVNGSSNPTVTINDTAAMRIQMSTGTYAGQLAEWWIIIARPDGGKWYYPPTGNPWTLDPAGLPVAPVLYGWNPIVAVDTVLITEALTLPGTYTVYFGLDPTYDNNVELAIWDSATISVPGSLPSVGLAWNVGAPSSPQMWPGTVGTPLTADMDITVSDGDYTSMDGELWVVCVDPDGNKLYYDPTIVLPAVQWLAAIYNEWDTMGNHVLAWNGITITSPNMDKYGTWTYYLLVDNQNNNVIDLDYYIYDKLSFEVGTDPQVALTAHTNPWDLSENCAGCLTPLDLGVWAYVYPGLYGSTNADFWVCAVSPVGVYSSYKDGLVNTWVTGIDYFTQNTVDAVKDGVIALPDPNDPSNSHDGWNYLDLDMESKLSTMTGTWTIYFGIDNLNGYVDSNIIYTTTTVKVVP